MDTEAQNARWLRRWLTAGLLVLAVGTWMASIACHGNVIRRDYAPNHGADFNFKKPPCLPAAAPEPAEDEVLLRYLGVSGVYLQWRGHALTTAPFFSDYSMLHAGFKSVEWHDERIQRGMKGVPRTPEIDALLIGHSHYDHIGDVPPVVAEWAPRAEIWVNATGDHMLSHCTELAGNRVRVLQDFENRWVTPRGTDGRPSPFRIMAIPSSHAHHFLGTKLANGSLEEPWNDCLEGHKIRKLVDGQTYAFLIDLLDADGNTVFRLHYQDSASDAPAGFPPAEAIAERPVDVAITCMPSWYNADDYPLGVLRASNARHVMVTHYEDFVGDEPKLHFVPLLTNRRANRFMQIVRDEMATATHRPSPPIDPVCGPASDGWSMPLPGEWLRFRTSAP